VVAKAAMQSITKFRTGDQSAVLGIGGPHYNQRFTQMALNYEAIFGHMIPKYALPHVKTETLRQCVERTLEKVDNVILDWKGIKSEHKPKLLKAIAELKLPYNKV